MPELDLRGKLDRDRVPYVMATVIAVRGSASAKPGSKMLVSSEGKNLWGWVGGGCAESFTITQALEALEERRTRIITADLDDEVFGLGMPCGGQMDIFLDPILPPEPLELSGAPSDSLSALADHYGFTAKFSGRGAGSGHDVVALAHAIAAGRGFQIPPPLARPAPSEFLILGASRITEELAKLGALAGWPTRVYGLGLDPRQYPSSVEAQPAQPEYAGFHVREGSFVVVASHHKGDHHYIAEALRSRAAYVGLVASRKRARLVFDHLKAVGLAAAELEKVRAPAGIEMGCRNPGEIALSIVAELLV